jgi:ParB family chromosome partitioning protein
MKSNASLGRGLSSLIGGGEVLDFNEATKQKVANLEIANVKPGIYQPRRVFDEENIAELAHSIQEKGILQPILVKQIGGEYHIIAGERRYKAAVKLGLDEIPALVLEVSENEAMEIALIENIQRENLNPIEEAIAYRKLVENKSYSQDQLAKKLGKSRTYITNLIRLLNLPKEVIKLVEEGKLTIGHARALIKQDNATQLANEVISESLSVRQTEELVSGKQAKERKGTILAGYDLQKREYITQLENDIVQALGLSAKIKTNGKKGSVTISYQNIKEMELIIKKLTH